MKMKAIISAEFGQRSHLKELTNNIENFLIQFCPMLGSAHDVHKVYIIYSEFRVYPWFMETERTIGFMKELSDT